ncbi:MAG: hypothetical protein AAGG50_13435 [Bacteroidota bacterium]
MLKPQDIVVLLKLVHHPSDWTYSALAKSLGMSASEVHAAVERASSAMLFDKHRRVVLKGNLLEFLEHGVKYAYPAQLGPISRGMATSLAASPLQATTSVLFGDDTPVWPAAHGRERGPEVTPLYKSVPEAASRDPQLYKLLALVDAIRVGRARERGQATKLLREALVHP